MNVLWKFGAPSIHQDYTSSSRDPHYRPDIDGLRAIAVVPVVLFHAGFASFSGGYVGVDVFFVISGFLITGIITWESNKGQFSLLSFYDRRVRRIIPALTAVIAFCICAGYFLMTPSDLKKLGASVVATVFFVSNVYFWRSTNYFDQSVSEPPLLHTWSLSIEEQFYLAFPLLLTLLTKTRRALLPTLVLFAVTSFFVSVVLVWYKPSATFYLTPTRAWELFLGGLICLVGPRFDLKASWRLSVAISGMALILVPIFAYTTMTRFPGLAAVPPALGSCLILWTGLNEPTFVHRTISAAPVVMIGKISYSLYLWHFPIIVLAIYATGARLSTVNAAAACIVSFLVSIASLHLIEKPFRFPTARRRGFSIAALLGCAIAGGMGLLLVTQDGLPSRLDLRSRIYLDAEGDRERNHLECLSLESQIVEPSKACHLGMSGIEPTVLLWGDSHAMVTANAMEHAAIRRNVSFLLAASVDCPIGLGFSIDPSIGPEFVTTPGYQYCGQYNAAMLELALTDPRIKAVVLSSRWTNWRLGVSDTTSGRQVDIRLRSSAGMARTRSENRRIFAEGFERLISELSIAGKTIWIVGPLPEPSEPVPKALYIHNLGFDGRESLSVSKDAFDQKNEWIMTFFKQLETKYRIKLILPAQVLCSSNECPVAENGRPLFFDDNHLSLYGVTKTDFLYDQIFAGESASAASANSTNSP